MEVKQFVFVSLLHTSSDKVALCKLCQVSFANTHNIVLTAVHSSNVLKDSMHAIGVLRSYTSYTPVLYQYICKLCNPLAKVSPADVVLIRIQQQA